MLLKSMMAVMAGSALLMAGPLAAQTPGGDGAGGIFAKAPKKSGKKAKSATEKPAEEQATNSDVSATAPASSADGAAPSANGAAAAVAPPANGQAASDPAKPECTADKPC